MDGKEIKKELKKDIKSVDTIKKDVIEVVDYDYRKKRDVKIIIENEEFTSVCPRTGLPDFGRITIRYIPLNKIIELKSLKLYFLQYRNVGIFYEHIVNKILEDLVSLVKPKWMEVTGEFRIRGGIKTTTKTEYRKNSRE
ncbi:MAG: NADPH-dependent 7-cyano-7-deazaguanine reductase QueF [Candidatus Cloacimonadota bacterium]|nr:MAG: NADPH-dependent 7-cyano-7-deazaguanine reductase QueF [Candidatus Cloacimonadota bacterium]